MAVQGAETPFQKYTHDVVQSGKFIWRSTSSTIDTFVLNGYDLASERMKSTTYEHVSVTHLNNDKEYQCSCGAFRTVTAESLIDNQITPSCCHCDFIREYVIPNYEDLKNESYVQGRVLQFIQSAYSDRQPDVLFLSRETAKTVKFSVIGAPGEKLPSFVHYTDSHLTCQSGGCNTAMGFTKGKRLRTLLTLDKFKDICPHLQTMKRNVDLWLDIITEQTEENEVCYFFYCIQLGFYVSIYHVVLLMFNIRSAVKLIKSKNVLFFYF